MITFTNLGQYGRLGNQLYQYAALKATALKHGYVCKIPNPMTKTWHGQNCQLGLFNLETEYLTPEDYTQIQHKISESGNLAGLYTPILEKIEDNTDISGFYQNIRYFSEFSDQIKKELTPKKKIQEIEKRFINKIKEVGKPLVSLHIRTGDMNDGTNPIYQKHYSDNPFDKNSTVGKYVTRAIDHFSDVIFLVFVGGSRTADDRADIAWAKNWFKDSKFIVSETNNPISDFTRMSLCDHNIISFCSSFSWWAAYINQNSGKTVVCPKNYHLDGLEHKRIDFFPQEWKQL